MAFSADKQTIKDLELFGGKKDSATIFSFYNKTETIGGEEYLPTILVWDTVIFLQKCKG